jgi:CxxC-x17-CxxC domain-containing protein
MSEFNRGDRPRRNFGPREMHKAVCASCQKECEVPFKPAEGRPVYCRECYASKKGSMKLRLSRHTNLRYLESQ